MSGKTLSRSSKPLLKLLMVRGLVLFAALLILPSLYAEESDAWLNRMQQAVHGLNYSGTYIYINDGQVETMRIYHAVNGKGERERLLSLNGEAREILRDTEKVTCILPADKSVVIGKHKTGSSLPTLLPDNVQDIHAHYDIEVIGRDRIAGLQSVILAIKPKDKMRYGYRIWLEENHAMLLRSDILDNDGKVMEQMMFTEIALQSPVPEKMLQASVNYDGFKVLSDDAVQQPSSRPASAERWRFEHMPAGFHVSARSRKHMPMKRHTVDHYVLTDGLATVSVYIEKSAANDESLEGPSSMGSVNAFGRKIGEHRVTVMGEVPSQTVEEIARAVTYHDQ